MSCSRDQPRTLSQTGFNRLKRPSKSATASMSRESRKKLSSSSSARSCSVTSRIALGDEDPLLRLDRAQGYFDGKFRPVLSQAVQLHAGSHRTDSGIAAVAGAMPGMGLPETGRDEDFDPLSHQGLPRVPEEALGLGVDEHDPPLHIDDDHRIRRHSRRPRTSSRRGRRSHRVIGLPSSACLQRPALTAPRQRPGRRRG